MNELHLYKFYSMRYLYLVFFAAIFFSCNSDKTEVPVDRESQIRDSIQTVKDQAYNYTQVYAAERIRNVFETRGPGNHFHIGNSELYSTKFLPKVYTENEFFPLWMKHYDSVARVDEMIDFIAEAEFHGLNPDDYHLRELKALRVEAEENKQLFFDADFVTRLDIFLSDAFFALASHIYYGKTDSDSLNSIWDIPRDKNKQPFDKHLMSILKGNSIAEGFRRFYSPHPGYEGMVSEAKRLKGKIGEDFTVDVELVRSIKPGDSLDAMALIKSKLAFLGFYEPDTLFNPFLYDKKSVAAVKQLQKQFGFNRDGVIGRHTLKALNVPVKSRIQQLYVNMERLRWMPDSLEPVYIMVNIADFHLDVIEGNDTLLSMRTIVGKDARKTPVFHSQITYLVLSPSWHIPPTIQKNDVIPAVMKNISYLDEKQMLVYDSKGRIVDPASVNWKKKGMKYSIKQKPGAHNSLGKVKFMFPNKYNIYLHDTPSRSLFARDQRTFSSGCIRVEKPLDLAALLLSDKEEWNFDKISQAMNAGNEKTVVLNKKIGVYIYYLTAWSTPAGEINYRTDIYDRDKAISESLKNKTVRWNI